MTAPWADGVADAGRGPGSLRKAGWKTCVAIGFLFLGAPGVCLDAYLKSQTPLCSSVGAEYVCGMPGDRNNVYPWHANRQEQCASICSPDMFYVITGEAISLVIR